MHCSCSMNNAPGTCSKKEKKKEKVEMRLRENADAIQTPSKKVLVQLLWEI